MVEIKLTKRPHVAGTNESLAVAKYIKQTWIDQGLDSVYMAEYQVLLSYPGSEKANFIEIISPMHGQTVFINFTSLPREQDKPFVDKKFPDAFNAYSPPGDVVGELVYANYGTESDFEELENENITITGKIVIARYGRIFRGNKVDNAAKRGAIGVILYTDPEEVAEAGTNASMVYNNTRWLPGDGMQRGSVYEEIGDPLTPRLPALKEIFRIREEEADLPDIPSQPIGYKDAKILLEYMAGLDIDKPDWQGKLGIRYRTGPGFEGRYQNHVVRMNIHNELKSRKIFNVIATIPGDIEPDRYVIVGSAHDAWGYGYVNPSSGTAQLLEISDAFSNLRKKGWSPRRTIIFCTWDASKYGQIGSTEWVEEHLAELSARAVVYINCESCIETEDFRVSASPILRDAVINASRKVPAADDGDDEDETVFKEWAERDDDHDGDDSREIGSDDNDMDGDITDDDDDIVISPLGAESDHAAFAFYAGIPSIDVHADNEDDSNFFPAENTAYDVYDYFIRFMDPDFKKSVSCAEYVSVLIRLFADKKVLPFDVDQLGAVLKSNIKKLKELKIPEILLERNITLFDNLEEAVDDFEKQTKIFNNKLKEIDENDIMATRMVNDQMMYLERIFIKPGGQSDDWFHRHLLFGPSDLDKYSDSIFSDLMDLVEEIDEIKEEEEDEKDGDDSDEGEENDIEPDEHWDEINIYLSDLLVSVRQATRFLEPFKVAYDD
uniref:Peptidase M28 domain-containing protein n=1 Tax=Strigamia maritima TaxID=126957 RepID=T1JDS1_STRMM